MDIVPDEAGVAPAEETVLSSVRKILVHAAYPLWRKHTLVTLARAKELQDAGNDVTVSYCRSSAGTCAVNYNGNPLACRICQARVTETARAAGLKTVPLDTSDEATEQLVQLTVIEEQAVEEGVNSGIISRFRTLPEECDDIPVLDRIRQQYTHTASNLLKSMKALVQSEQPDVIEVFNGRHACSKSAIIAANSAGIPFNTLEITARQKPIVHHGHLVHDRMGIQRRIKSQPVDMEVAGRFFEGRRHPQGNKFANKHKAGFEPPSTDSFKKSVSIFLSSQDEFASLGDEWVSPFLDYAPIVQAACEAHPDILFCIRFHPNQANVASDVLTPFKAIEQLPNTKIYYPTDQVNSYSLMDWSDVVVTFGSTITIEACWAGKPVIMLGPSYFDQLDVSYTPASPDEFIELLGQELFPKSRENAARVAYYHEHDQDTLRYVKFNGKKLVADGLEVRHPWLGQLARSTDDILCNLIKVWARKAAKANRKKVA